MNTGVGVDMFQHLPECLLCLIISFLPFKEAAKTCVLSKRWKHVWLCSTNVELNENHFIEEVDGERRLSKPGFLDFARRFMSLYRERNVYEFRLSMSNPNENRSEVESWINFAVSRNVHVLDLDFWSTDPHYDHQSGDGACFVLPAFVYKHMILRVLKLCSCDIMSLELTNYFMLNSLYLERVNLDSKSLKTLISGCPLLEMLSLKKCSDLDYIDICCEDNPQLSTLIVDECTPLEGELNICAPKLRSFKYFGSFETFDLESLFSLEDAELDFGLESIFLELGDLLCDLLQTLYHAKVLTVCSYTIQVLPSGTEALKMSREHCYFGNLKHLIMKTGVHRKELPGIAFLLRTYYSLETLSIEMGETINLEGFIYPSESVKDYKFFWEAGKFHCLQTHLKRIIMKNFQATENAIGLLEFLLAKAMVLQEMVIFIPTEMPIDEATIEASTSLERMISQFNKGSPDVMIYII